MSPRPDPFLTLWYMAASAPLGISLTSPLPTRLQTQLYNARKRSGDPSLHALSIRTSPTNPRTDLWLIKSGPR